MHVLEVTFAQINIIKKQKWLCIDSQSAESAQYELGEVLGGGIPRTFMLARAGLELEKSLCLSYL